MSNRHSNVIVDAEAGSALGQGEMQPPGRMKDVEGALVLRNVPARWQSHHRAHCYECTACDTRRGFMHARLDWCVSLAKAIAERQLLIARKERAFVLSRRHCCCVAQALYCSDVVCCVHQAQFLYGSGPQGEWVLLVALFPQATCFEEIHQSNEAAGLEWMFRTKIIRQLTLFKEETGSRTGVFTWHGCHLPAGIPLPLVVRA